MVSRFLINSCATLYLLLYLCSCKINPITLFSTKIHISDSNFYQTNLEKAFHALLLVTQYDLSVFFRFSDARLGLTGVWTRSSCWRWLMWCQRLCSPTSATSSPCFSLPASTPAVTWGSSCSPSTRTGGATPPWWRASQPRWRSCKLVSSCF